MCGLVVASKSNEQIPTAVHSYRIGKRWFLGTKQCAIVCVRVCVCVWERESAREREREVVYACIMTRKRTTIGTSSLRCLQNWAGACTRWFWWFQNRKCRRSSCSSSCCYCCRLFCRQYNSQIMTGKDLEMCTLGWENKILCLSDIYPNFLCCTRWYIRV